jgi:GPH family glycoside/pentoside/hexuronide:cation symporter
LIVEPAGAARPSISWANKLSYGLGIYAVGLAHISVGALSLFFYTEILGLSAAQAASIFFLGTLADLVTEVAMAYVTSRTHGRLGPYRPYIIAGAVPYGIFVASIFIKVDVGSQAMFSYALSAHILFRLSFGLVSMPYTALISRLSTDPDERASIGAVKGVFSAAGGMTATYLGLALVHRLGAGDDRLGYTLTGIIFGVVCAVALLVCGIFTRESPVASERVTDVATPGAALKLVASNPALLMVLFAVLLFFSSYTMMQAGIAYYFKYYLRGAGTTGTAFLMISLAGLFTPPLWAQIIYRVGKRAVWIAGACCAGVALSVLAIATPHLMPLVYAMYFLFGAGNGALVLNYAAITADAVDIGRARAGVAAEPYAFACLSLASRLSIALGGGAAGWTLSLIGLRPAAVQTVHTLELLPYAVCLPPALLAFGSAIAISRYRSSI